MPQKLKLLLPGISWQVGTASLTGMMLDDSGGTDGTEPLQWVQRQEIDELKVCRQSDQPASLSSSRKTPNLSR